MVIINLTYHYKSQVIKMMSEGLERKDALWLWAIVNVRMRIGGTWPTTGVQCEDWAQVWSLWKQMYKCGNCGNANCPRARLISRGSSHSKIGHATLVKR